MQFNCFNRGISRLALAVKRFYSIGLNEVELTSTRYKDHVQRGDFARLNESDINVFQGILGKDRILTDPADLELHNTDWIRIVRGII